MDFQHGNMIPRHYSVTMYKKMMLNWVFTVFKRYTSVFCLFVFLTRIFKVHGIIFTMIILHIMQASTMNTLKLVLSKITLLNQKALVVAATLRSAF